MITIGLDPKTKKFMKDLKTFERRWNRGLERFAYAFADQVRERVRTAAGDRVKGVDYAQLEVLWFQEIDGFTSFAVVLPESARDLAADEMDRTALTILANQDDEKLLLLQKHSPWTTDLIPFVPAPTQAQVVTRRVSTDEIAALRAQLLSDQELAAQMSGLGLSFNKAARADLGRPVSEDLAWTVLRHEFGLSGEPMVLHWRRSLRTAKEQGYMEDLLDGFLEYVVQGDQRAIAAAKFKTGSTTSVPVMLKFQKGLGV